MTQVQWIGAWHNVGVQYAQDWLAVNRDGAGKFFDPTPHITRMRDRLRLMATTEMLLRSGL